MHSYQPLWGADGSGGLGDSQDMRFAGPTDVVVWASQNILVGRSTWPEVFHLEDDGTCHCSSRDSSFTTVKDWAARPLKLYQSRWLSPFDGCPDRWLVVESRPNWYYTGGVVDEGDAKAFVSLRIQMAECPGIDLVDVMIFDDELHWWSLHELTSGQDHWPSAT